MNDISDSYKQTTYPLEPIGSYNIPIGSLCNAQLCHATLTSGDTRSSSEAVGSSMPLGRLLQMFIPLTFMKFASKCSA